MVYKLPNVFSESKVASYCDNIKFKDLKFEFSKKSPEKILTILKVLNSYKATGIDKLSSKFLKDATNILARPISQILISLSSSICSLEVVKLQKSNCFIKKDPKVTLKTTTPF